MYISRSSVENKYDKNLFPKYLGKRFFLEKSLFIILILKCPK